MRVFLTGDTHRNELDRIEIFCEENNTTTDDIMIILGDAGINYYLNNRDIAIKEYLSQLPITIFCIHGNHEERPENIKSYHRAYNDKVRGFVYIEENFPNLLFAIDNKTYFINNNYYYTFGGGYSVDKEYRLTVGANWFPSEINHELVAKVNRQLNEFNSSIKEYVSLPTEKLTKEKIPFIILTHTCPLKYQPNEVMLHWVKQDTVDKTLELLFDRFDDMFDYKNWYCGHWHIDKTVDKIHFLFRDIIEV